MTGTNFTGESVKFNGNCPRRFDYGREPYFDFSADGRDERTSFGVFHGAYCTSSGFVYYRVTTSSSGPAYVDVL